MLAVETYAFSHGFDYGISLRMLLKSMKLEIPLYIFTDSKFIFDTITASKHLRELRLMNEIADIRHAYRENEITNIAWIRSDQNIADNFTRHHGNNILRNAIETGRLNFIIEQWVYKDNEIKFAKEKERMWLDETDYLVCSILCFHLLWDAATVVLYRQFVM